ncbi:hypothetical protein AC579_3007 [Pseudocercospora musae]|uniref:Uncharacterized protein n=1 Tax=Pseudocercospora musae TaxID=113226 RepID=A0A139GY45_9PEZI|nr:hypothetical protein AC579_3007 [Pseudocercospora musae]
MALFVPRTYKDLLKWTDDYELEHLSYAPQNEELWSHWAEFLNIVTFSTDLSGPQRTTIIGSQFGQTGARQPSLLDSASLSSSHAIGIFCHTPSEWSATRNTVGLRAWLEAEYSLRAPVRPRDLSVHAAGSSGQLAAHPGPESRPEAYLPEEIGPKELGMASSQQVIGAAEKLRQYAKKEASQGMGCSFAFASET